MTKLIQSIVVALVLLAVVPALCSAATVDLTVGGTTGYPATQSGKSYLFEKTVDFTVTTGTSGNTYKLLNIPAGAYISMVGYQVNTGNDAACTVDLGDAAGAAVWFDNASVRTGAVVYVINSVSNKVYQTADTLNLLLNNDNTQGKVTVRAVVVPMGAR
jgi:hypothetical protein